MLLRSSSSPILGSLLSSFCESPNHNFHCETNPTYKHPLSTLYQKHPNKLSFNQTGYLHIVSPSCTSSPISPSIGDSDRHKVFRRAQSEGNLQGLVHDSCNNENQVCYIVNCTKSSSRKMLEPIPSFSHSNSNTDYEEEEEEFNFEVQKQKCLFDVTVENKAVAREAQLLSLDTAVEHSSTNLDETRVVRFKNGQQTVEGIHLARGLGLESFDACGHGGFGGGVGGECNLPSFGGDGDDGHGVEEYYKKMVDENPGKALFLSNYAHFLYQSKRDLNGADEYYCRAILADPKDGEVLSQYAKLVWELNHDRDRAASYHERAVKASPEDSYIHAAYAAFLWETEEDEDSCDVLPQHYGDHGAVLASASV